MLKDFHTNIHSSGVGLGDKAADAVERLQSPADDRHHARRGPLAHPSPGRAAANFFY